MAQGRSGRNLQVRSRRCQTEPGRGAPAVAADPARIIRPMDPKQLPGQTPLAIHRDPVHGLALLYPDWWQAYDIPDGRLFTPGDHGTFISIEARRLGTPVTAADLPDLERGFLAGLRKAPGSKLLSHHRLDSGLALGLEARQLHDGHKRWIRLLYRGDLQVRLVAQGATEQEFDFWLPSFDPAMTGFVFDAAAMPGLDPLAERAPPA